jgi:hypothetical protein
MIHGFTDFLRSVSALRLTQTKERLPSLEQPFQTVRRSLNYSPRYCSDSVSILADWPEVNMNMQGSSV